MATGVCSCNGYLTKDWIAGGAFGKCYLVEKNKILYACKTFESKTDFDYEVSIHSQLNHHNIVQYIESFACNCALEFHIIMDLCNKGDLSLLLKSRKTLNNAEVRYIAKNIIDGLDYLHSLKIIHRDLKLKNVLITQSMVIKIADFGLSAQLNHDTSTRDSMCGTTNYLAPEMILHKEYSFQVDIWALGCIIYTLLDGKSPFASITNKDISLTLKNIVNASFKQSKKLTVLAKSLLRLIFVVDDQKRSSTMAILNHQYFNSGFTPRTLPADVFERETKMPVTKKLTSRQNKNLNLGRNHEKENIPPGKMVLRSDKRLLKNEDRFSRPVPDSTTTQLKCFKDEINKLVPLRTKKRNVLQDVKNYHAGTNNIEKTLKSNNVDSYSESLSSLKIPIVLEEFKYLEYKECQIKRSLFRCVSSWFLLDCKDFGYRLNDGSVGIKFNNNSILQRSRGGVFRYLKNRESIPTVFNTGSVPHEFVDAVAKFNFVRKQILQLEQCGPSILERNPMYVENYLMFDCEAFEGVVVQLSSCVFQVNFSTHQKFVVDLKEETMIFLLANDYRKYSIPKIKERGLPSALVVIMKLIEHLNSETVT